MTLPHDGWVLDARFSPDGRSLATGSRERLARVWDLATGRLLIPPMHQPGSVTDVRFSDDGRRLITRTGTAVRVWEISPMISQPPLFESARSVLTAAFSADGTRVITATEDNSTPVRVWDAGSGDEITSSQKLDTTQKGAEGVSTVALSADGKSAFAAIRLRPPDREENRNSELCVWPIPSRDGKPEMSLVVEGEVVFAAFGNSGPRWLVVIARKNENTNLAYLIDVKNRKSLPIEAEGSVQFACFDPKDKRLMACGAAEDRTTGIAHLWSLKDGELFREPGTFGHTQPITYASFGPGDLIGTASVDNTAKIWDAKLGEKDHLEDCTRLISLRACSAPTAVTSSRPASTAQQRFVTSKSRSRSCCRMAVRSRAVHSIPAAARSLPHASIGWRASGTPMADLLLCSRTRRSAVRRLQIWGRHACNACSVRRGD